MCCSHSTQRTYRHNDTFNRISSEAHSGRNGHTIAHSMCLSLCVCVSVYEYVKMLNRNERIYTTHSVRTTYCLPRYLFPTEQELVFALWLCKWSTILCFCYLLSSPSSTSSSSSLRWQHMCDFLCIYYDYYYSLSLPLSFSPDQQSVKFRHYSCSKCWIWHFKMRHMYVCVSVRLVLISMICSCSLQTLAKFDLYCYSHCHPTVPAPPQF